MIPKAIISRSTSRFSLKPIWELYRIIQEKNIQVLHCHLRRSLLIGILISFFCRVQIIFHEHGSIHNGSMIYRWLIRTLRRRIHALIAVSQDTKNALVEIGVPETSITVIPNCIDPGFFSARYRQGKSPIEVGIVGRLTHQKGLDTFLKVLPRMKHVHCTIVGSGEDETKLKYMARTLPVRFLGYRSDMKKVYAKFDVLVVPSRWESFCITAIEAQAMGIPVIAHDIPVMREIGGGSYILYKSPDQLPHIFNTQAWDSEEIRQRGIENAKGYTVKKYANRLKSFYSRFFA